MTGNAELWAVPEWLQLRWHSWGDGENEQFVVFNALSGETHCLNLMTALVLQRLQECPASAATLAAELREELPGDADKQILEGLEGLLKELDRVGLIALVRV